MCRDFSAFHIYVSTVSDLGDLFTGGNRMIITQDFQAKIDNIQMK